MSVSPGADPAEAQDFLARHPDIEAVDLVLVDVHGIGRGKIIRRHELMALYREGRHLPSSILGLDLMGEDVEETGLVWEVGDADRRAWPVPGTLVPMPWTSPARAQVLVSLHDLDGTPLGVDPRHAHARQVAALAARGLVPAGAFELEFYLLDAEPGPDGRPRPAPASLDGRRSDGVHVYGLDELDGQQPLFSEIYRAAKAQGLPLETLISEYAPGQFELTLHYRKDLVRAADDLVMLKRLVRAVARRHKMIACFMAKPFGEHAGSGMHLHVSLADQDGRNVFSEAEGAEFVPPLKHALGGLAHTMGEAMLVFAPHANSWRRFVAKSYAPVAPTWGINNRSVALRVPAGAAAARRIEHRPSGVDANPHVVATAVLAGIAHGLDTHADPGPPVGGDGYAGKATGHGALPRDWREAIDRARGSAFLREALGPELHRVLLAVTDAELHRVASTVSELDYRLYLHHV
jgi:glutamine synthetase